MGFQQGLSGLNASSKNLEVIGNNVANSTTVGAKSSRAEFGDMYATAIGGASVGIGVTMAAVTQQFTQGTLRSTDNPLDLAINGSGFFEVNNNGQTLYTRNGQFHADRDGFITSTSGMKLMGYPSSTDGTIQPGGAKALQLPTAGVSPNPTSKMGVSMNLDSREGVTLPAAPPMIDFQNAKTYNDASSITVFDEKGQDVALTYFFQKAATDTWNVYATANGTSAKVDGAGRPLPVTTLTFPPNGGAAISPTAPVPITVPATTNAAGSPTLPITALLDMTSATQYGASYGVTHMTQNGYAAGQFTGVSIDINGLLMGTYSNGQSKAVGQIELANFRNPQGLSPLGGNVWARTAASGEPAVGIASSGSLGTIKAGTLEESNTDLTGNLVDMIVAQRIYQANAQTIKTQDQVFQTLVNLR